MNLLKLESSKIRVKKKRIRATLNDSYRDKILMGQSFYMRLPWPLGLFTLLLGRSFVLLKALLNGLGN